MARSTYTPPQVRGTWTDWATSFLTGLVALLNRTQKIDEDFEPPTVAGAGSRIVMTAPNGTRWALSVSNAGATVWTAL